MDSSLNPGAIAILLFFMIALILTIERKWQPRWWAVCFIVGVGANRVLVDIGMIDYLIFSKTMEQIWDVFYFILALLALGLGVAWWRDWCLFKRTREMSGLWIQPPGAGSVLADVVEKISSRGPLKTHLRRWGSNIFAGWLFMLLGGVAAILIAAWPSNVYLSLVTSQVMYPGQESAALGTFILLGITVSSPFWLSFIVVEIVLRRPAAVAWMQRSFSLVQVVGCAVSLATGISLLSYYWP